MGVVIKAENLGKKYLIGHQRQERYVTLRDSLTHFSREVWQSIRHPFSPNREETNVEEFWALQDVNIEIKEGDRVGIIGRNGAGKSTLLKILSRITEPTTGRVHIKGRVASLLEVGTGFHPELTGRENIFLNGAILGMSRHEIKRKFDEIIAFAEVEKFLDTPVKRYSSGMYVRLAFAVAAHLESEILLLDEVLAVGDSQFQKRCLGKMGQVAEEGRTIVFVSHNMAAIQQFCNRGMVLSNGKKKYWGDINDAVNIQLQNPETFGSTDLALRSDRRGSQWLRFIKISICDKNGNEQVQAISGQDVCIRFYYVSERIMNSASVNIAFNIRNSQGSLITNINSLDVANADMTLYQHGYFQCVWPRFALRSGLYDCALFCSVNGEIVDWLQSAFSIQVEDGDFFHTGRLAGRIQGDVLFSYNWSSYPEKGTIN